MTPLLSRSVLFSSLVLGLTACHQEQPPAAAMPPAAVTIAHPVKETIKEWSEFTGRIDAAESVNLYCQVTGYLQEIHFKDGAEVKKGDLLFVIDPRPFQAVLDQANAEVDRAKVKLELAKSEFDRAAKLVQAKAISAEDFDTRNQAVREAQAALKVTQATAEVAALNVEYTHVKAPMDGRIGRRLMDIGGLVIGGPMGATLLASIVSIDPIYCYIDADELSVLKQQRLLRESKETAQKDNQMPCEMALADEEGFPHKGIIDFVDNRLDPNTGTIQTRAVFSNPKPERGQRVLQPGYFARVRITGKEAYEALLIDDKAVGADQAQKVVMVVGPDNLVAPRPVEVGPVINGKRVIRSGITEQDRVIVNGQGKVRPGMPVAPMTEEEAAKAAAAAAQAPAPAAH